MRILLVAHSFPRHPSDLAGSFLHALARGQQALGHEVLAVAPHDTGLPLDELVDEVRVRRYRYGPDAAETLAYRGTMADQVLRTWNGRLRILPFLAAARVAVRRAVDDFAPDLVHVHWWFPGGLAVWPRIAGDPPYVLTSHGTDLFLLDRAPAARLLAGPIFRTARETTVISTPLVDRARALGVKRARITVVPMPVDPLVAAEADRAGAPGDRDELLFVGRLVERKGAAFAIRALAELAAGGRSSRLTIVGGGPDRRMLGELAHLLGVAGRVTFTGALPPRDVRDRYRRAGILVMPAVTDWKGEQEGFGMVIVEAMAFGVPVVATRSGGIPDILRDGENGLLVAERDPAALAQAIARLADEPELAVRLAEAGRRDVRDRFAPRRIAARFDEVYQRVAGAGARGAPGTT